MGIWATQSYSTITSNIESRANKKWSSDTAMETSINLYSTRQPVIPTMAGSRTYVGLAYYNSWQLITPLAKIIKAIDRHISMRVKSDVKLPIRFFYFFHIVIDDIVIFIFIMLSCTSLLIILWSQGVLWMEMAIFRHSTMAYSSCHKLSPLSCHRMACKSWKGWWSKIFIQQYSS